MKKAIFSLIIICPYLLSASELEWQAEFRYRMMQDRTSSVANTETYNEPSTYSLLRSRIFFKLINGPVSMNLQLQDSRILGYSSNNPGLTKEDETIPSFHQVYLHVNNILKRNWSVQLGRFELALGQQRLIAKSNWNNIGRSFEGFLTYRKTPKGTLRLFHLINDEGFERFDSDRYDQTIDGFYFDRSMNQLNKLGGTAVEIYGFRTGLAEEKEKNRVQNYYRNTYGSRLHTKFLIFTLEAEGALQFGSLADGNVDGLLTAVNIGINLDFIPIVNAVTFGNEYISGDDQATKVYEGFAKPFGAGHKWHGYYDAHKNFGDNIHLGLKEWNVKAKLSGLLGFNLNLHYHNFSDAVYNEKLGDELDLIFSRKLPWEGNWSLGYALYWEYGNEEPFDFTYLMISFIL